MKRCLGLVFGLFFSIAAYAEVHEFKLDNGLTLLVKEDHRAPVVVSQVWYKVGSSYEQEGHTGISHVLEHMMFKGTEKYGPGEFSKIMAANGARENAFTSSDFTAYYQILEKSRLPVSFEMEADRMRYLSLREEDFLKEVKVVMEERRMRTEDKPTSLTYEVFKATAFQTSPYQNPIIGWMQDLKNLTLADIMDWYRRWYAPNNAIVVVVGDVTPQAVLALAKQHFSPLQAVEQKPPVYRPEVKQLGIKRVTVKRPAEISYLLMGYKVPVLATADADNTWEPYALELLSWVLDGDSSSRLTKHLVRGQEIASSIGAGYDLYSRLDDLFLFSGVPTQQSDVKQLEQALRAEIEAVKTTPVTAAELARIKTQLLASKIYERDSLAYQAQQIGMLASTGLDYKLADVYVERLNAITPAQVQAVAQKYLIDEGLTVAVLEPQPMDAGI
jgi:zinc protease